MVDEKVEQEIRICGAPGCDNPTGKDGRRRFCSMRCSKRIHNEKAKGLRKLERLGRVCAIGGCQNPVTGQRSRYCSKECAVVAYGEQVRAGCKRSRKKKQRSKKSKPQRHKREYRPIRLMQHVTVEKWPEYRFLKKGVTQ